MTWEREEALSLVVCGEAGQGIQTVENILIRVFKLAGYNVFSSKEYMSRVRGGENSTLIRVSSKRVRAYQDSIDILLALSKGAIKHLHRRISPTTLIIADEQLKIGEDVKTSYLLRAPFMQRAQDIGGYLYSNVIAAGMISSLLQVHQDIFEKCLYTLFSSKGEKIMHQDLLAGEEGYLLAQNIQSEGQINIKLSAQPVVGNEILLNGSEAVGLGCLAGGCQFISSYPMTPSTPLQVFLAQNSEEFGIIFEQAEDEIAAINLALGASYAGARSMVATSGSGFALMVEAIGLAGMIETPVVVYIGQRPGPAVGLPTRTAQEDLNLALYAGPGEFPRIIFAPGTLEEACKLSARAFHLADKFQIPVFILSDQYLADLYYNLPELEGDEIEEKYYIKPTREDYRRYELTADGISPRGIPGWGEGLVVVDSDEHDQTGHLTEDLEIRNLMVDKRLKKMDSIRKEIIKPSFMGYSDYDLLIIGWGSNYGVIKESMENRQVEALAFLHLSQVFPLHPSVKEYIEKADQTVIFENNAQSQLANLIKLETGQEIDHKMLKYNGMPFSVEEVTRFLNQMEIIK